MSSLAVLEISFETWEGTFSAPLFSLNLFALKMLLFLFKNRGVYLFDFCSALFCRKTLLLTLSVLKDGKVFKQKTGLGGVWGTFLIR